MLGGFSVLTFLSTQISSCALVILQNSDAVPPCLCEIKKQVRNSLSKSQFEIDLVPATRKLCSSEAHSRSLQFQGIPRDLHVHAALIYALGN